MVVMAAGAIAWMAPRGAVRRAGAPGGADLAMPPAAGWPTWCGGATGAAAHVHTPAALVDAVDEAAQAVYQSLAERVA